MAGTRWNKIGTVYRQSGLTILTTLHHPKCPNVVQGGPKLGQKGQKQHLFGPGGPGCPKMAGTRWNKIGTVYRQTGLTILTALHHPKYQDVVPGRSQNGSKGSKTAFIGSRWSMVPQNGLNKVE